MTIRSYMSKMSNVRPDPLTSSAVVAPDYVQLFRQGKYNVMMRAVEQHRLNILPPLFSGETSALRAGSMLTGVIPDAIEVAFGAVLCVTAKLGSATNGELLKGAILIEGKIIALKDTFEVLLKDVLHAVLGHKTGIDH